MNQLANGEILAWAEAGDVTEALFVLGDSGGNF